jgi:uncharacterized protein YqfB (UPF0267 family)
MHMYAEQENSVIARLKKIASHMWPDTLLWLLRYVLYVQAGRKEETLNLRR